MWKLAIAELKTVLEGEDDQQISEKSEALSAVLMKLGEAAYQGEQDMAGAQADDTNARAKIMMMWWMPSLKRLMMTKTQRKPDPLWM